MTISLPSPTDNTPKLVSVALWGLKQLYRPGYNYAKAGIMLGELVPAFAIQTDLFSDIQPNTKSERLMQAMDLINRKMGKESLKVASEGFSRPWKMKQENKSPCYTTNWSELIKVS